MANNNKKFSNKSNKNENSRVSNIPHFDKNKKVVFVKIYIV